MYDIIEVIGSLIDLVSSAFSFLLSSFVNGINFFASAYINVPLFVIDTLESLPWFFQVGLTGVFGLILFVVMAKLVVLVLLR